MTGNATIISTHVIMAECDQDVLGNEEIIANEKKVFTRWTPVLLWCERWSVLPAVFGESRVVEYKQLARTDTCRTRPCDSC